MSESAPPLSFAQEQLWFIDEFHHGLAAHNLPGVIRLAGELDVAALAGALAALAERHEPLRTRLAAGPDGRPAQLIDPPGPAPELAVTDLSALPAPEAEQRLRELADADALEPFHLGEDHPLRVRLVRLAPAAHALVLVAHQVAVDDRSLPVLVADLAALYGAAVAGQPAGLAPLPGRFAEHAERERELLHGGQALAERAGYWKTALAGLETSRFPADWPRPVLADHTGAIEEAQADAGLASLVRELSARAGTTMAVTLLAAQFALLQRYTGQEDLVLGLAGGGAGGAAHDGLVAFLEDVAPVRVDASGDPSFSELVARVRDAVAGARAHHLPFARIVDVLDIERDPGRFPLFQSAFRYAEAVPAATAGGVELRYERAPLRASRYDVAVAAEPGPGGLRLAATYPPALYKAATIARLLVHYEVLLRGALADPSAPLSRLPLLTDAELRAELADWNDTDADLPVQCVHAGFEERAALAPSAVAAEMAGGQVSYGELNRQANQVARLLRGRGVGPEVLVGVAMGTSLRRLAALIGVWKAGGGYVPLDPALPAERLAFMIADTGMRVVLTDDASAAAVPAADGVDVVSLDAAWDEVTALGDGNLSGSAPEDPGVTPANLAYVIYTSGSTGQPKGVMVEHGQCIHFLHGMARHWRIGPGSAVLQFAAFTFDVSVADMFMALLGGAKVVLAGPETLHSPPRLAALVRDAGITFACLPPTVLNLLTGQDFPELRTLLSSGEELSSELLKAWLHIGADIYNGYGPTECSIGSVFMKLEPSTPLPPPIGRPKPNYRAYVLDGHLNPVPVGVTGELHIGGPGVSRGYLNRPDLTREKFIPDPFSGVPGARLYKTGDLARRRPDGTLVFAGRIDGQVKLRGLRVELGEIETALAGHPDVAQAVVIVVTDRTGTQQLAGYLRPADGATPDAGAVRQHVARTLPSYMIPTYLVTLAELPLTAHGKVNKAALPSPLSPAAGAAAGAGLVPPRTVIEVVLTDLYTTVLGVPEVGATTSFFDAGGNSLQAMRLITELRVALAVDLDIAAVFLNPAPRQLATVLRDKHGFTDGELGTGGVNGVDQYLQDNPA
ncbi:MAG TPA: amino acid adenylation domain-containing protein [Trebonia sp.]|jgi:amino acid adenylation domain-containing protein|nr:amino acid adenylation domain-containing protein [Trebonia sp.]